MIVSKTPKPAEEAGAGESAMLAEGKTVFTTNCASCHTLKEAGASGEIKAVATYVSAIAGTG